MTAQPHALLFGALDGTTAAKLAIVADPEHPVGRDTVAAFLAACEADAKAHDGRVSVSRVGAMLPDDITSTTRYSSLWSAFTGRGKPMRRVAGEIDVREGSASGNNGRMGPAREWVGS